MKNIQIGHRRLWRTLALALPMTLGLLGGHASGATEKYKLIDLGALNGANSYATGINNLGQVVGESNGHAVLWSGASMVDLGVGSAYAINDAGKIVGESNGRATLWSGTTKTDLGAGAAYGINGAGQIVGRLGTGWDARATLWNGGTVVDLPSPGGGGGTAYGINDGGKIVGESLGGNAAILWNGNEVVDLGGYNPDTGEGIYRSSARAINEAGQIVGSSWSAPSSRKSFGTLWSGQGVTMLGPVGPPDDYDSTWASDINAAGQIVGGTGAFIEGYASATLWEGTTATDLNTLVRFDGWRMNQATGINDQGWIVGSGIFSSFDDDGLHWGPTHALLLIPVPEPETYLMVLGGLAAACTMQARKKHPRPPESPVIA